MPNTITQPTLDTSSPLDNLGYFTEWGGGAWEKLTHHALGTCLGGQRLEGKNVLEIGTRYGKMATLFALLGAKVTAIDIEEKFLDQAAENARQFGVRERIDFQAYDGDLDVFPDEAFDVIFTKSVLVVVPELDDYLGKLERKLKPSGEVVFIENAKGLIHVIRRMRRPSWDYRRVNYLRQKDLQLFRGYFEIDEVKQSHFPPVFMIYGHKKADAARTVGLPAHHLQRRSAVPRTPK